MKKKAWSGQINLFDFISDMSINEGPVEMVSLMPEDEPKEVAPSEQKPPVMHKIMGDKEIAYYDYNRVYIKKGKQDKGHFYEFASSKEAVDFYIEQMIGE